MQYRVVLPNDYECEADAEQLSAAFPGLDDGDLEAAALEQLAELWPAFRPEQPVDFGYLGSADTPPPDLPAYYWISRTDE
jgi:hypothetical protein